MSGLRLGARLGSTTSVAFGFIVSSVFAGAIIGAACASVYASAGGGAALASRTILNVYLVLLAPLAVLLWGSVREPREGQVMEIVVPGGLSRRAALGVAGAAVVAVLAGIFVVGLLAAQVATLASGHRPAFDTVGPTRWAAGVALALAGVYVYEVLRTLRMPQIGIHLLFLLAAVTWMLALVKNPGDNPVRDLLSSSLVAYPWSQLVTIDSSRFELSYTPDWPLLMLQVLLLAAPLLACVSARATSLRSARRRTAAAHRGESHTLRARR